jgi:hypothetical protein
MKTPTIGGGDSITALPPGLGAEFRRELLLRSAVAIGLAVVFLGTATYGAAYAFRSVGLGVAFLVIGAGGVLSQMTLASAMLRSRSAISGDAHSSATVARARRFAFAGMVFLAVAAVVAGRWVLAAYGGALASLAATGLLGVAGISAPAWSALRRLASHTRSAP